MRLIFPDIKIIFMVREPLATIWSMRQREWGYSLADPKLRNYSLPECIQIWKNCVELAHENYDDPNWYICSFERLVKEPKEESCRILRFISSKSSTFFIPKTTDKSRFSDEEKNYILQETRHLTVNRH
jgi:hypothetical protein